MFGMPGLLTIWENTVVGNAPKSPTTLNSHSRRVKLIHRSSSSPTCSHTQAYQLLTVEQTQSSRAKYLLEVCVYEFFGEKVTKHCHILFYSA